MADKKILLFAVLLLAACTADPAMDGADGGNSSANTAAAAKLINTPYDAKQGSLIVCFDDAAVPTIELRRLPSPQRAAMPGTLPY